MSQLNVFLPWCSLEDKANREQMQNILLKAGMQIIPLQQSPENEIEFMQEAKKAAADADCSLHIIGVNYGKTMDFDATLSIAKFQFNEAKKRAAENSKYKAFVWYPSNLVGVDKDSLQEAFINEIRHSITNNIIFTTIASPIQLVDDIRSMMEQKEQTHFDVNETDIFIMFNEMDEGEAEEITDMLSDIVSVEKLNIIQDSDTNYSELCNQQIGKSKLAVVYFKETSDWALPFVQQVWKKVGGASSNTAILLIGDEDPDTNKGKIFKAPKVVSLIVSGELIPLEIKVQYDKAVEEN
ncbi:MAG TPA: hypothetical protein DEH02_17905 [Bacteroidales bacterium]|nr:MAG: hypothetical protein A2X01_07725 [Bacteroidetes bacterium GWF2_35_48]HBX52943.1 hypothetical protein [Bacteroidales bacterium]